MTHPYHPFQEMNLPVFDPYQTLPGSITGSVPPAHLGPKLSPPQPNTVPEVIGQLRDAIAVSGKITEELSARLSPLIRPRPTSAGDPLKSGASDCCPLANELHVLREMVQNTNDQLSCLLREIQL